MRVLCGVLMVLAALVALPASANGWRQGFVPAQMQRHPDRFQRQPQRERTNRKRRKNAGP